MQLFPAAIPPQDIFSGLTGAGATTGANLASSATDFDSVLSSFAGPSPQAIAPALAGTGTNVASSAKDAVLSSFAASSPQALVPNLAGAGVDTGVNPVNFGDDVDDAVLSSFIEEDRYDYSGRPPGFSAHGTTNGTIDGATAGILAEELRKRQVSEDSVGRLEALAASGSPLTIGTAFIAMSGNSRRSAALEGETRDAVKNVLAKIGFSRDETEEMLALSDDGDGKGMWKRLNGKLKNLEGTVDVSRSEWNSLLRGLDLSDSTRKQLLELFQGDSLTLDGEQMELLLAGASKEFAAREKAALYDRSQMRSAVEEALRTAKIKEQSAPVDNVRGSRLTEQKEEMMLASVRKNTGSDQIKQEKRGLDGEDDQEGRKDGKSRSERILATESEIRPAGAKSGESAEDASLRKLFRNMDASVAVPRQAADVNQAQNLNTLARSFRQEIFSQVRQGMLHSAQNSSGRLTLQLSPGDLGQVTVVLSVIQGEVKAAIRAENQESAEVLREQMTELKASLEAQGFKVKELDVQAGLQNSGLAGQWNGHNEHNLMRDAEERNRMIRLSRIRREAGHSGTPGGLSATAAQTANTSGLHIVA
jgi:hypothetical protein